ncbi:MAG: molybdopterin-dependent oxidoreductase [Candidatus Latescibacteria bacterium]|nr:molybdopterin-dependent oxidoreductase [Candidatus Latescibacterota bacterium]
MPTIIIDGREITVEAGTRVLKAALDNGIPIPHYCYHPALSVPGNCRMCMVEIEVQGRKQLTTSCTNLVSDGMVVYTETPLVLQTRKDILEFLLVNHPLDCPVCDRAGECALQDYSYQHGLGYSRFEEEKVVFPRKDLGPHVRIYSTRCVRCTRCLRFCDEVTGTGEIGYFNRGVHNEIDVFPGVELDNRMSGNVVDICPVGALIDRDFLFQARVWYLKSVESVCPRCSAGCNITVNVKDDKVYGAENVKPNVVYRVKPRTNMEVNTYWICDGGRYGVGYVNREDRLEWPEVVEDGQQIEVTWEEALGVVKEGFSQITIHHGAQAIALILSGQLTNEENYLAAKFAKEVLGTSKVAIRKKVSPEGDVRFKGGFVIEADKTPNSRGARDMATALGFDVQDAEAIWREVEEGTVRALYVLGGEPEEALTPAEEKALGKVSFFVVQDILPSQLTEIADVVLPGTSFAEKEGTFTNSRERVQRIRRAIAPPGEARADWEILQDVANVMGGAFTYTSAAEIWGEVREVAERYTEATYEAIGSLGVQVG